MEIEHRPGNKHSNADGLSRIPDTLNPCDYYHAGTKVEMLPCGGCNYCQRAHIQWERFHEDVDNVIPLALRSRTYTEPVVGNLRALQVEASSIEEELVPLVDNWMDGYSKEELRELQLKDPDLQSIIGWIETDIQPEKPELCLQSQSTRSLWLCKEQLRIVQGVLFYLWDFRTTTRHRLVVPQALKDKVL
jgi:hypothetical protein